MCTCIRVPALSGLCQRPDLAAIPWPNSQIIIGIVSGEVQCYLQVDQSVADFMALVKRKCLLSVEILPSNKQRNS